MSCSVTSQENTVANIKLIVWETRKYFEVVQANSQELTTYLSLNYY